MTQGEKHDTGKLQWSLLPLAPMRQIIRVLMRGAKKYEPDSWKHVKGARERYYDAMTRHITDWWDGERNDPEWGLHHLAHAGCCLLFLLWFEMTGTPYPVKTKPIDDPVKICTSPGAHEWTQIRVGPSEENARIVCSHCGVEGKTFHVGPRGVGSTD